MKKVVSILLSVLISLAAFSGCMANGAPPPEPESQQASKTESAGEYTKHQAEFYELFDTYTVVIAFAETEADFEKYHNAIYDEMARLHKLFDIYNDYAGINNVKTINDNAAKNPVKVDADIIELLLEGELIYEESGGVVNVAMGRVLKIWHDYRSASTLDPENAKLPPMEDLKKATAHTNIADMVIDEANSTVFLKDAEMALDVGSLAKGFAVQKAMEKAKQAGMVSGIISAGGNVATAGKPLDGRDSWSVGIQNPEFSESQEQLIDMVKITDAAVVTSGGYQRFYVVDGKSYHHIIDPVTLMPADRFSGVSVIHPDSGTAEMLSTAVFIFPIEQGEALVKKYGAEAIWITSDGKASATDGYKAKSQLFSKK